MYPSSFTTECNQKYFIFHTGCPPVRKETNIERSSRVVELCWARCYLLDRRSYKEYTSQQDDAVEIVYILLHFPNVGVPNVTDTVFPSTTHEVAAINLHVSQVRHEYYLASRRRWWWWWQEEAHSWWKLHKENKMRLLLLMKINHIYTAAEFVTSSTSQHPGSHATDHVFRDPSPWLLLGGWGDFRSGGGRGEYSKFVTGQILTFQRRELTTTQHWTGAGK